MTLICDTLDYRDDDVLLEAFWAYDDGYDGLRPAVLVNHAWGGRDEFVEEKAKKLAELGYVGFALDVYGKGVSGGSKEENAKLMQPFMQDRAMLQKRLLAAFTAVKSLPCVDATKVAAIGFCFGGLCVLDLARSGADLKGVVSFHGLLSAPEQSSKRRIKAKILALHGHDDPLVPVDQVLAWEQELTAAGADWQLHTYGNTMHAFTNPVANDPEFGTVYNAIADRRSWYGMVGFLDEIFSGA